MITRLKITIVACIFFTILFAIAAIVAPAIDREILTVFWLCLCIITGTGIAGELTRL